MKKFTVDINVGDTAMVGRFKNVPIKIVDIHLISPHQTAANRFRSELSFESGRPDQTEN